MSTLGPQFEHVYHATNKTPDEFMKAPTIHVGEDTAALNRLRFMSALRTNPDTPPYDIHVLKPSQHMEVHPEKLRDEIANAADYRYLKKNRYPVTQPITDSLPGRKHTSYQDARQIVRAAKALGENKALLYKNTVEGGDSMIIPAPHHNTSVVTSMTKSEGTMTTDEEVKDPHTQTPLPMDYTVLQKSEVTKKHQADPRSADKRWDA